MSNENILIREKYQKTLHRLLMMIVLAGVLTLILSAITVFQKQASFYATTSSGLVIPLHTLDEPIVTNDYVAQWTSLAVRKAFNIDFVHYADQLNQAKIYFTPNGWDKFNTALNKSKFLQTIQDKKLLMTAVTSDTPVILNQDVLQGRYTWRMQLPILVTFSSASQQLQSKWLITLNVQRVSVFDTSEGIQISDFVVERM